MKLTALFKKQKTQAEETPAEGGSSADKSETVRHLDEIERIVYAALKPLGFRKHGRTLHRFTSGDVSQCVSFRCGQARREESHLMWVGLGIGVPECMARFFQPDAEPKKYYKDYECNIRADLGDAVGAASRRGGTGAGSLFALCAGSSAGERGAGGIVRARDARPS